MSAFALRITRRSGERPRGLDIGDLDLEGDLGQASSRGRSPDQGMMIYISVADLLETVVRLVEKPKLKVVEFVGTDSSFAVVFRRTSRASVRVWSNGDIAVVADRVILCAAIEATQAFLSGGNGLGEDDMARSDLDAAIRHAIDVAGCTPHG